MARSYRKTPIFANTTAESEKKDKKIAHGKERARLRTKLHNDIEDPAFDSREAHDIWDMDKDGKHYVRPSQMEKDVKRIARYRNISIDRAAHKIMAK